MAKIQSWVNAGHNKGEIYERVAKTTEALLMTIEKLDDLAKPKQFKLHCATILQFEEYPSTGLRHTVRVMGCEPIEQVTKWQVYGSIGGKIVNVVAYYLSHTHKGNGSGSGEFFINSVDIYRSKLTLDDVWQDNNKWQYELEFVKELENAKA